uniref:Uncharacterized protein n=1 Tax=Tanacetum cinerariifolium TaxID=118510 RepID=A0A6L2MYY0_TANCI|nr:hypothetical protein [Tanacetum cinerariifolium]
MVEHDDEIKVLGEINAELNSGTKKLREKLRQEEDIKEEALEEFNSTLDNVLEKLSQEKDSPDDFYGFMYETDDDASISGKSLSNQEVTDECLDEELVEERRLSKRIRVTQEKMVKDEKPKKDGLQFVVGVSGGSEDILHHVNRLIEGYGDDTGLSMFLVDFKNPFNLVDREVMLREVHLCCPVVSRWVELCSCTERIVTASGPGFGEWQWRLAILPFAFGGLGVYSTVFGPIFNDALCKFNTSMETDLFKSTFSLSHRQMALWKSQRGDHTSDWLRTFPISKLGQTMNGKTYGCVLCYRFPLFSVLKPCSTCSRVFTEDIYGDHVISCAGINGIKHCRNVVHNTLIDICFRSGISAGLDVCVDLTGSSPLTQNGMADFVPGREMIDAAQRKRVMYMTKCAAIGYGFLLFSFFSLRELEDDAVTLLNRIRKFSMTQDIGAHVAAYIFNRISFAITKGVEAQIVSRLLFNLL